jgi:hypothetical protein
VQTLEDELRREKSLRRQESGLQMQELTRLLETVKNEIQRKYNDELMTVLGQIKEM